MILRNRYYAMRHGESRANLEGIIVSDPTNGVDLEYGLTSRGRRQARVAARLSGLGPETTIFTSDFSRARQTAHIAATIIGTAKPQPLTALRERHFGDFEGTSNENYELVWAHDAVDPHHGFGNVESASHVLARAAKAVLDIELEHENEDILLVSHGDILQILQTGFAGLDVRRHRSLPHLGTAEIRPLRLHGQLFTGTGITS